MEKKGSGFLLLNDDITLKEMRLAIPYGATKQQLEAIQKSKNYANSNGAKIIVTEVK